MRIKKSSAHPDKPRGVGIFSGPLCGASRVSLLLIFSYPMPFSPIVRSDAHYYHFFFPDDSDEMDLDSDLPFRRISFLTSCERDRPFVRPSVSPRPYLCSQASSRPTTGISSCFSKSGDARHVSCSPPSSSFSAVSSPGITTSTLPPSSPVMSSPPPASQLPYLVVSGTSKTMESAQHSRSTQDEFPETTSPVRAKTRSLAALLNPAPELEVKYDPSTFVSRLEEVQAERDASASECTMESSNPPGDEQSVSEHLQAEVNEDKPGIELHESRTIVVPRSQSPYLLQAEAETYQGTEPPKSLQDAASEFDLMPSSNNVITPRDVDAQSLSATNTEADTDSASFAPEGGHRIPSPGLDSDSAAKVTATAPPPVPVTAEVSSITLAITITASSVTEHLTVVKRQVDVSEPATVDTASSDVIKAETEEVPPESAHPLTDEQLSESTESCNGSQVHRPASETALSMPRMEIVSLS